MVTVAHALVHGIRGTVGNLLFSLYVGQDWLSPATLSMGGAREEQEVDRHYIAAIGSAESPSFSPLVFYLHSISNNKNCCAVEKITVWRRKEICLYLNGFLKNVFFVKFEVCSTTQRSHKRPPNIFHF